MGFHHDFSRRLSLPNCEYCCCCCASVAPHSSVARGASTCVTRGQVQEKRNSLCAIDVVCVSHSRKMLFLRRVRGLCACFVLRGRKGDCRGHSGGTGLFAAAYIHSARAPSHQITPLVIAGCSWFLSVVHAQTMLLLLCNVRNGPRTAVRVKIYRVPGILV